MSGVFQNFDPTPPSPPSECVLPPHQRRGGGEVNTRRAVRGGGGSIFWKRPDIGLASYSLIPLSTVTSREVNFRYPDRMLQTRFVHIAKNFLPSGAHFLLSFPRHRNFPAAYWKNIFAQVGSNFRPSDYQPDTLPMHHSYLD